MNKQPPKRKAAIGYALPLPPDVRNRLAAEAKKSRRSLNSEIIVRLEQSLRRGSKAAP